MGKRYRSSTGRPTCQFCGKLIHSSRKEARRYARDNHPGDHLSPYRCVDMPEGVSNEHTWHIGHMSPKIKYGAVSRYEHHSGQHDTMQNSRRAGTPKVTDNHEDKGTSAMATIGEVAKLTFKDHGPKGIYENVTHESPLPVRVGYVHRALKAHAIAEGFERSTRFGKPGYVGHVAVSRVVRELFADSFPRGTENRDEKLSNMISNIRAAAGVGVKGSKAFVCLEQAAPSSGGFYDKTHLPIWWIAEQYEIEPSSIPVRKPGPGRRRGGMNKATERRMAGIAEYLREIKRPSDAQEMELELRKRGYSGITVAMVRRTAGLLVQDQPNDFVEMTNLTAPQRGYGKALPSRVKRTHPPVVMWSHIDFKDNLQVDKPESKAPQEPAKAPQETPVEQVEPDVAAPPVEPEESPSEQELDKMFEEAAVAFFPEHSVETSKLERTEPTMIMVSMEDVEKTNRRIAQLQAQNKALMASVASLSTALNLSATIE